MSSSKLNLVGALALAGCAGISQSPSASQPSAPSSQESALSPETSERITELRVHIRALEMQRLEQIKGAFPHGIPQEGTYDYAGISKYENLLKTVAICSHDASAAEPQLKVLANKVADNPSFKQACSKAENPRQWRSCVEKELPNFLSPPELLQYYDLEYWRAGFERECIRKGTAEATQRILDEKTKVLPQ